MKKIENNSMTSVKHFNHIAPSSQWKSAMTIFQPKYNSTYIWNSPMKRVTSCFFLTSKCIIWLVLLYCVWLGLCLRLCERSLAVTFVIQLNSGLGCVFLTSLLATCCYSIHCCTIDMRLNSLKHCSVQCIVDCWKTEDQLQHWHLVGMLKIYD